MLAHNAKGYDNNLIISNFQKYTGKGNCNCIAQNPQTFFFVYLLKRFSLKIVWALFNDRLAIWQ